MLEEIAAILSVAAGPMFMALIGLVMLFGVIGALASLLNRKPIPGR